MHRLGPGSDTCVQYLHFAASMDAGSEGGAAFDGRDSVAHKDGTITPLLNLEEVALFQEVSSPSGLTRYVPFLLRTIVS